MAGQLGGVTITGDLSSSLLLPMMHYAHSFGCSDATHGSHFLLKDWCSQEKKIWFELEPGTQ
ncbi:hypothetical protein RJ639_007354 [Escallonia herrerae]|uniref:Uncharacterized protein n=1 Tax=Escallonia herrerae TaxID=1293975 RepID=A0AA88VY62_9ASTE|nr:hypothetical protein RJ639_007354 [Escallonia herrerae]